MPRRAGSSGAGGRAWSLKERKAIYDAVVEYGEHDWNLVTATMLEHGRSVEECTRYWRAAFPIKRGSWGVEEDRLLSGLVTKNGVGRWNAIASHIPGRNAKQCRERWVNNLDPSVKKGPWSADEDAILIEAQGRLGNRWSQISRLLEGRPDNAVKNRWYCLRNRLRSKQAWTASEDEALRRMRRQGMTWKATAKALKRDVSSVRQRFARLPAHRAQVAASAAAALTAAAAAGAATAAAAAPAAHHSSAASVVATAGGRGSGGATASAVKLSDPPPAAVAAQQGLLVTGHTPRSRPTRRRRPLPSGTLTPTSASFRPSQRRRQGASGTTPQAVRDIDMEALTAALRAMSPAATPPPPLPTVDADRAMALATPASPAYGASASSPFDADMDTLLTPSSMRSLLAMALESPAGDPVLQPPPSAGSAGLTPASWRSNDASMGPSPSADSRAARSAPGHGSTMALRPSPASTRARSRRVIVASSAGPPILGMPPPPPPQQQQQQQQREQHQYLQQPAQPQVQSQPPRRAHMNRATRPALPPPAAPWQGSYSAWQARQPPASAQPLVPADATTAPILLDPSRVRVRATPPSPGHPATAVKVAGIAMAVPMAPTGGKVAGIAMATPTAAASAPSWRSASLRARLGTPPPPAASAGVPPPPPLRPPGVGFITPAYASQQLTPQPDSFGSLSGVLPAGGTAAAAAAASPSSVEDFLSALAYATPPAAVQL